MLITAKSDKYTPPGYVTLQIKRIARYRIYRWNLSGNDRAIDNYCRTNYKCSLKDMCWHILRYIKVLPAGTDNSYTIILPDKELDKIAHIITYGNGEFLGSKILQKALEF